MELLIEHFSAQEAGIITESSKDGLRMALSGVFMQAEIENRNKRKYKLEEMVQAVRTLNETISAHGGVLSEVDHPENRISTLFSGVGAMIVECTMDGNNAVGKMKILDTPKGEIVKECIRAGFRPGVSSRGAGNVGHDGVVEGFVIQTVDIVVTPSAAGAMPKTIFESIDQLKSGRVVLTLAEQLQHDAAAQKYFTKEIRKFLADIMG